MCQDTTQKDLTPRSTGVETVGPSPGTMLQLKCVPLKAYLQHMTLLPLPLLTGQTILLQVF